MAHSWPGKAGHWSFYTDQGWIPQKNLKLKVKFFGFCVRHLNLKFTLVIDQIVILLQCLVSFSLLKVHLQLRGFSVFLDIEKLKAGKFDENLLNSVKLAKNFILVLTPNSLDRCMGDDEQNDWVHKVTTQKHLNVHIQSHE